MAAGAFQVVIVNVLTSDTAFVKLLHKYRQVWEIYGSRCINLSFQCECTDVMYSTFSLLHKCG
jgi:hypothetical protein